MGLAPLKDTAKFLLRRKAIGSAVLRLHSGLPDIEVLGKAARYVKRQRKPKVVAKAKPVTRAKPRIDPELAAQMSLVTEQIQVGELDTAEMIVQAALDRWPPSAQMYRKLAMISVMREDWETALHRWCRSAYYLTSTSGKQFERARTQIIRCNANLALQKLADGRKSEALEHIYEAIGLANTQTYIKRRPDMVQAIAALAGSQLNEAGYGPVASRERPKTIVICLDVIKISPVHTHRFLYLSMAASLLALDPEIRVHIVATHERQIAWQDTFRGYYGAENENALRDFVQASVPKELQDRLFIRYYNNYRFSGFVRVCKDLLDLQPDIILYGSGDSGFHANESKQVRHTLFDFVPTAFFFVQSNNAVDERNDVIIARGPYELSGDPGEAKVLYNPYPSFPGLQAAFSGVDVPDPNGRATDQDAKVQEDNAVVPLEQAGMTSSRKTIVTAWVGIRLDRALNSLSREDIDSVLSLLDKFPDYDWHIIGSEDPRSLFPSHEEFRALRAKGRIVVHRVQPPEAFYRLVSGSTVFFHPPGFTGGGGGASIARNNDIPVICFRNSDVAPLQPRNAVFDETDFSGAVAFLSQLLESDAERADLADAQRQLMAFRRTSAGNGFYDCLCEAVRIFENRTAQRGAAAEDLVPVRARSGETAGLQS